MDSQLPSFSHHIHISMCFPLMSLAIEVPRELLTTTGTAVLSFLVFVFSMLVVVAHGSIVVVTWLTKSLGWAKCGWVSWWWGWGAARLSVLKWHVARGQTQVYKKGRGCINVSEIDRVGDLYEGVCTSEATELDRTSWSSFPWSGLWVIEGTKATGDESVPSAVTGIRFPLSTSSSDIRGKEICGTIVIASLKPK